MLVARAILTALFQIVYKLTESANHLLDRDGLHCSVALHMATCSKPETPFFGPGRAEKTYSGHAKEIRSVKHARIDPNKQIRYANESK